jgi:hypothetical protein
MALSLYRRPVHERRNIMSFHLWAEFLKFWRRKKSSASQRPRFVPLLETLEDRTALSTLTVTSAADDGSSGTLRAAIASAGPNDTIGFAVDLAGDTFVLTQGQLVIGKDLTVQGLGADDLTISANYVSRVFDITGGARVTIAGLTIAHGLADHGGAIWDEAGSSLTLSHVILSNNQAVGGLGGGAIFNDAGARPLRSLLLTTVLLLNGSFQPPLDIQQDPRGLDTKASLTISIGCWS